MADQAGQIRNAIHDILKKYENDEALAHTDLDPYDFIEILPDIRNFRGFLDRLMRSNLEELPRGLLESLDSLVKEADGAFAAVNSFYASGDEPTGEVTKRRDIAKDTLLNSFANLYKHFAAHVAESEARRWDPQPFQADLTRSHEKALQDWENESSKRIEEDVLTLSNLVPQSREVLEEVSKALTRLQEERTKVSVAQHAEHFKNEAEAHRDASKNWLIAAGVLGVATLGVAVWWWGNVARWWGPDVDIAGISAGEAIAHAIPRVIVLSLLTTGLAFTLRTHNSHRHNDVVNRHRMNSLNTFDAFVAQAADDPDVKNAILLQTSSVIFSPQVTGFTKGDYEIRPIHPGLDVVKSGLQKDQSN